MKCGTEKVSEKKSKDMEEISSNQAYRVSYITRTSVEDIADMMKSQCRVNIPYGVHVHTQMALRGVSTYADIARIAKNEVAIERGNIKFRMIVPENEVSEEKRVARKAKSELRKRRSHLQEAYRELPMPATQKCGLHEEHKKRLVVLKHARRSPKVPTPHAVRQIERDFGDSYETYSQWGIPIKVKIGPDEGTHRLIDRLCKSVSGAVIAATGGDGKVGVVIRRVLMALVPAIVLMLAVKLFGKTVSAVIGLLGAGAFAFLGPFKHMFDKAATQMGENGETALVSKIVAVAALAFFMKKKIPLVAMAGIISRLPSFQVATRNVMDWGIEAVQWMVNSFRHLLGKERIVFWKRRADQVTEWMDATAEIAKTPDGAQQNPEKVAELRNLGVDLLRSFPDSNEIKSTARILEEMYITVKPILKTMRLKRVEPLCVVLYGKPGIGKSLLVKRLAAAYLMKHFPDLMGKSNRDPGPYMFVHDGGEFWNGFNEYQHKVMVMDDLGSRRTEKASESDIASLMPIINTTQYPLNMAGMLDKGNTYFRSDYVIATTNKSRGEIRDFAAKVLTNPEAIDRRMHLFIEVTLKPEFVKDDRFNMEKANRPDAKDPAGVWHFEVIVEQSKEVKHFDSLIDLVKFINTMAITRQQLADNESAATHEFLDAIVEEEPEETVHAQGLLRGPVIGFTGKTRIESDATEVFVKKNEGRTQVTFEGNTSVCSEYGEVLHTSRKGWLGQTKEISQWVGCWWKEASVVESMIAGVAVGVAVRLIGTMLVSFVKMFIPSGRKGVRAQGDMGDEDEAALHTSFVSALSSNSYVVTVHRPNKSPVGGINVLFIKGRLAIMPAHYIAVFRDTMVTSPNSMVQFENALGESFTMKVEDFGADLDYVTKRDHGIPEDMVMLKLNSRREHRNIIQRFRSNSCWISDNTDVCWWRVKAKGDLEKNETKASNITQLEYSDSHVADSGESVKYRVAVGYEYKIDCRGGDCGALLVHDSKNKPDCIMGMHVAGNLRGKGNSIRLSREWLVNASEHFVVVEDRTLPAESVRPAGDQDVITCQSMKELVVGVSCVSAYSALNAGNPMAPSRVNEWSNNAGFDVELQRPSDTSATATLAALESHATPPELHTTHPAYLAAARDYFERIGFDARGSFELLSVAEAAEGTVRGVAFAPAINKKSSAGFPYQSKGYLTNQLFDRHGAVDINGGTYKKYKNDCDIAMNRALVGHSCRNIFAVCPKPETRPYHKVLPRIIQAANKPYTINWRRLFWPLTKFYSEWKPTNECAIGMNPFEHWNDLAHWLLSHSGNIIAGDYSGFDKTHEPVITNCIWQALSERFDQDEYNRARSVLWRDTNGAEVQLGRLIYKLPRGLPSGHPGTAVINSAYNSVLMTLAYTSILSGGTDEEPFGPGWEKILPTFRDHVRLQVLGDDNIMSSTCEAFNELSIGAAMKRFGAKYTMDQKLATAVSKFRPLHEVTFIGRGFRPTFEGFDPNLRLTSILDMGKWVQKRGDDTELWQVSVLESILAELSLHDQDVWNRFAPLAWAEWKKADYRVPALPVEANETSKELWKRRVHSILGGYYE